MVHSFSSNPVFREEKKKGGDEQSLPWRVWIVTALSNQMIKPPGSIFGPAKFTNIVVTHFTLEPFSLPSGLSRACPGGAATGQLPTSSAKTPFRRSGRAMICSWWAAFPPPGPSANGVWARKVASQSCPRRGKPDGGHWALFSSGNDRVLRDRERLVADVT